MRIAGPFPDHRAKSEPLGMVKRGRADLPVVQREAFGACILEEELTVVGPG